MARRCRAATGKLATPAHYGSLLWAEEVLVTDIKTRCDATCTQQIQPLWSFIRKILRPTSALPTETRRLVYCNFHLFRLSVCQDDIALTKGNCLDLGTLAPLGRSPTPSLDYLTLFADKTLSEHTLIAGNDLALPAGSCPFLTNHYRAF